jgi:hypothetical protein
MILYVYFLCLHPDSSDGFNVSAFLVTGVGGDSTKIPDFPTSYALINGADLQTYDTGQGASEVLSVQNTIFISNNTNRMHVRFATANQAGRAFQIVLRVNPKPGFVQEQDIILQSRDSQDVPQPFRLDPAKMMASFGKFIVVVLVCYIVI